MRSTSDTFSRCSSLSLKLTPRRDNKKGKRILPHDCVLTPYPWPYSPSDSHYTTSPPLPMGIASSNDMVRWEDDVRQAGNSGILFEQPPWADDHFYTDDDDDEYEDEDDDPGMESFEPNDGTDDSEDDDSTGAAPRWKMDPAMTR
jgi:hypothetical protein